MKKFIINVQTHVGNSKKFYPYDKVEEKSLKDVAKFIQKDLIKWGYSRIPTEDIEFTLKDNNELQYTALANDVRYIVKIVD